MLKFIIAATGIFLGSILMGFALRSAQLVGLFIAGGSLRNAWRVINALLWLFFIGYLVALALVLSGHVHWLDLVVGLIFLGGSAFVLLMIRIIRESAAHVVSKESLGHLSELAQHSQTTTSSLLQHVGGNILVIEDDALNRAVLERILETLGHNVTLFPDAESGLEALLSGVTADIILLDLLLPGLNGLETLDRLKANSTLAQIPVVIISAVEDTSQIAQCIENGAVDYLSKPFSPILLRARLEATLSRSRLRTAERRSRAALEQARARADGLLRVLLPPEIAGELTETSTVKPRRHDQVAVIFADIVGFTSYCEEREPEHVLLLLQKVIGEWEELARRHNVLKIKTVGDAFMGAAGLEAREDASLTVASCIEFGLAMLESSCLAGTKLGVRVGIHVGPVVAGIVGHQQFQYDIWGDTVNTASRIEAYGEAGEVCLSQAARSAVIHQFKCVAMETVNVKGKGMLQRFQVSRH